MASDDTVHYDTNDWVRGFLAGVAFCETNVYDKPLEMQQRAYEYHENVPMLLEDVWIPEGLGYSQGAITPLEYERTRHTGEPWERYGETGGGRDE